MKHILPGSDTDENYDRRLFNRSGLHIPTKC